MVDLFNHNAASGVTQMVKWLDCCCWVNIARLEKALSQSESRTRKNCCMYKYALFLNYLMNILSTISLFCG